MEEKNTMELLVVDTLLEKHLMGVINGGDIFTKSVSLNVPPSDLNAEQCMKPIRYMITETSSLEDCQRFMKENHLRRVPVVDKEGHVSGLFDEEKTMRNIG